VYGGYDKMKQQRRLKLSGIQVGITSEYFGSGRAFGSGEEIGDSTLLDAASIHDIRAKSCSMNPEITIRANQTVG
jgi:hypothetical protein